jgi:hypothetical protein
MVYLNPSLGTIRSQRMRHAFVVGFGVTTGVGGAIGADGMRGECQAITASHAVGLLHDPQSSLVSRGDPFPASAAERPTFRRWNR